MLGICPVGKGVKICETKFDQSFPHKFSRACYFVDIA